MIYGKNTPDRNLTEYEIAVNSASFELAKANPGLLAKRDELFRQAREKARESGYLFKKGSSRSKGTLSEKSNTVPSAKRSNTTSDERKNRLLQIDEEMAELKKSLQIKEARRNKAQVLKDFGLCDKLSTEIRSLVSRKQILENEIKIIKRKEEQSKWYRKKRKGSQVSQHDEQSKRIKGKASKVGQTVTLEEAWSNVNVRTSTVDKSQAPEDVVDVDNDITVVHNKKDIQKTMEVSKELESSSVIDVSALSDENEILVSSTGNVPEEEVNQSTELDF